MYCYDSAKSYLSSKSYTVYSHDNDKIVTLADLPANTVYVRFRWSLGSYANLSDEVVVNVCNYNLLSYPNDFHDKVLNDIDELKDKITSIDFDSAIDGRLAWFAYRFQAIQGDGFSFMLQSDTHYSNTDKTHRNGIKTFSKLTNYLGVDFVGNLGDVIQGYQTDSYTKSENDAMYIMRDYLTNIRNGIPLLIAKGNHDDGSLYAYGQNAGLNSLMDKNEQTAKYIQPIKSGLKFGNDTKGMYYYRDFENHRGR